MPRSTLRTAIVVVKDQVPTRLRSPETPSAIVQGYCWSGDQPAHQDHQHRRTPDGAIALRAEPTIRMLVIGMARFAALYFRRLTSRSRALSVGDVTDPECEMFRLCRYRSVIAARRSTLARNRRRYLAASQSLPGARPARPRFENSSRAPA